MMSRLTKRCPKCGKKWTDHYMVGSAIVPEFAQVGEACWVEFDRYTDQLKDIQDQLKG